MTTNKRVLITGANGFIGANLTYKNLEIGNEVHILTKKTSSLWRLKPIMKEVRNHQIALDDLPSLKNSIKKINPDIIYHLAVHGAYPNQTDLKTMVNVNITSTINLLLACQNIDYQAFINTGSSSEYGFKNKPMKETDLLEPASYYAATKGSATLISQAFALINQKNIITLRPFSVYGPWEESTRLIPTLINRSFNKQPLEITESSVRHDFIYVDDMVEAYLLAARMPNISGNIFNIGSGVQTSNLEIAEKVIKITKANSEIIKGAFQSRDWDARFWVADLNYSKKVLKWSPQTNLELGLKKTITWFKENQNIYEK